VVGKKVFIVGGGNSAGQAAMFLSSYALEVKVLIRGEGLKLSMSQYLIDQIAPPMLMPIRAIFSGSTPGSLSAKSTTGVITFSQSGRKGRLSR
jgi:hypothetical protein